MRTARISTVIRLALAMAALSVGGCGVVSVDMTSTPATVRSGDPVTFDIKLTNHSQCPLETSAAILIPFISRSELNAELSGALPPDAPPEVRAFLEELRAFIEGLCSGGTPAIPTPAFDQQPPVNNGLSASCHRGESAIVCEISGRVQEPGNGMTFTLFRDQLHCEVNDQIVGCEFQVPLPQASTPSAVAAAAISSLTCLTAAEFAAQMGIPDIVGGQEFGAICFLGSLAMPTGLGPNGMATGQVILPARGSGPMLNFVFALSGDTEDVGVCKGGSEAGAACDRSDSGSCSGGGTCGEGICTAGGNAGKGCDVATMAGDCPGGACQVCAVDLPPGALPLDCTTTYVSPDPAPVMSSWGLIGMAILLLATGTLWLQRQRNRG